MSKDELFDRRNNKSIDEKRHALQEKPDGLENRLFYAARNSAIEALCLRIQLKLLQMGVDVKVKWSESSFGSPSIVINFSNPKPTRTGWESVESTILLNREKISVYNDDQVSPCFYTFNKAMVSCHMGRRIPKLVQSFWDILQELVDSKWIEDQINFVNYPFSYQSSSSF